MSVRVRRAIPSDSRAVARVHVESWRGAYRGQMPDALLDGLDVGKRAVRWQELLAARDDSISTWVALVGKSVVGFCHAGPSRDEDAGTPPAAEIRAIYVLPEHWRSGAGWALCGAAREDLRERGFTEVTLWVLDSNARARAFYERQGFRLDGDAEQWSDPQSTGGALREVRYRAAL